MDIRRPQFDGDAIRQELQKQYNRATTTSPDDVDLLAIDLFASMVQQYETAITYDATKIIAEKFKSSNADEVLLALNVLEECMSKCGPKFHSEVGKFRFLNELIRLVSPQYQGDKTPKKIRDKILDLMLLWTIHYPHEKKIKEAYEMLLKRGVRHEFVKAVTIQNPTQNKAGNGTVPGGSNSIAKQHEKSEPDLAAKLKSLLQSSNPCDHKAANLLIQNMVKEKERRLEVRMRKKLELKEIHENASLLKEMLEQVAQAKENGSNEEITEDALATLKYLYESCKKLQPTILILTGDMNENDSIDETFEVNDLLTEVLRTYNQLMRKKSASTGESVTSSCLLSSTICGTSAANIQSNASKNTMEELNEIFSSSGNHSTIDATILPMISKPLEPTPIVLSPTANESYDKTWQAIKELNNGSLSQNHMNLLKASPPSPPSSFNSVVKTIELGSGDSEKCLGANPIQKPTSTGIITAATTSQQSTKSKLQNFDSELTEWISGLKSNLIKENEELPSSELDDEKLLGNDDDQDAEQCEVKLAATTECQSAVAELQAPPANTNVVEKISQMNLNNKALAEFYIDLNTIRPHDEHLPRCILDDKCGLKIVLNLTKDRPRDDIAVLVITTTNQNAMPVTNFQFEASVSRPCKVHLQKPSGHELPGIKPFRPPTEDITQILLVSNAERKSIKLVCIISYVLDDDPDPVKEFLEIDDLPDLFN